MLPSYREGVPRTLMEASAMGRPIVATDVPGCREVVEDGVNGLLCEVRNADSLTEALERMLTLAVRRARGDGASAAARKSRANSTKRVVVERYKGTNMPYGHFTLISLQSGEQKMNGNSRRRARFW